ncbi:hypothetical protein V6N13_005349 [Hibiscus sabdariffa]|uniref:Uncharacterized protein n=1 Tax=Hibiscus sabdariffa TaxID=183260 RepID=A0ABR2ESW0_9ROSI
MRLCNPISFPFARGDCTCDPEDEDRDKSRALKYKTAAIASILVAWEDYQGFTSREESILYHQSLCHRCHPVHWIHSCSPRCHGELNISLSH